MVDSESDGAQRRRCRRSIARRFFQKGVSSLLVVTCLIVVREIVRTAARSRELVERVRRASSRFARAVTVYTYTRIRIRIKRFTVYTIALFWRTRARNLTRRSPPPVRAYASFYFLVSIDQRTNSLGLSLSVPGKRALSTFALLPSSFAYFSSAILFLSRREPVRRAAPRRATAPYQRIFQSPSSIIGFIAPYRRRVRANRNVASSRKSKYVIRISLWRKQRREPGKP